MNFNLAEYLMPLVVVACFSVGYIIKNSLDFIPNKYIPLVLAVLGACLANVMSGELTWEHVICGAFSGLASTGLHQAFYQLIKDDEKTPQVHTR